MLVITQSASWRSCCIDDTHNSLDLCFCCIANLVSLSDILTLTMVFTAAQLITFFIEANQMGLTEEVVDAVDAESMMGVSGLEEFHKKLVRQIVNNLRLLEDPLTLGAESTKCLIIACKTTPKDQSLQRICCL